MIENLTYLFDKYKLTDCTINDDMAVDAPNVYLDRQLGNIEKLPIIFNNVGYFDSDNNKLTSLEGSPKRVEYAFRCSNNRLTSLVHSPIYVGSDYVIEGNKQITSLEGLENTHIGGDLLVWGCDILYSLEGYPKSLGDFYCDGTPISPIYRKFIKEPYPDYIKKFNKLKVIDTDGAYWYVDYDNLGKFLRSIGEERLMPSELEFESFLTDHTKYHYY